MDKSKINFNLSEFGKRIKATRVEAGLSQKDIADNLGYQRSQISHWETGIHKPPIDGIAAFMELCRRSRIPHELNFLILGDPVGAWRPASRDTPSTHTMGDKDKLISHLESENTALRQQNQDLLRMNQSLLSKVNI